MRKLLVAGVAGLMLMAAAGAQTAMAAPWRGAPYRGHYVSHTVGRSPVTARPTLIRTSTMHRSFAITAGKHHG